MGKVISVQDKEILEQGTYRPLIEAPAATVPGDAVIVTAKTGREVLDHFIPHPHVRRLSIYFYSEGGEFPFFLGQAELIAMSELYHDARLNTLSVKQELSVRFKMEREGTVYAASYSNFFGSRKDSKRISFR